MILIRQIRSLLYDQGYTIGGARQRMSGEGDEMAESGDYKAVLRQMINELEDVLEVLTV